MARAGFVSTHRSSKLSRTGVVWLVLCFLTTPSHGGASCCMSKAGGVKVPDPYATKPVDWDDDDDGPW